MVVGAVLQNKGKPFLWRSGRNPVLMPLDARSDCAGDTLQSMTSTSPCSVPPDAPFFIVMNGGSGRHDVNEVQQTIQRTMAEAGRHYTVHVVTDASKLAAAARSAVKQAQARGGVVVAAGGDGTINALVQATLGSGCVFGVLPQGTFNYFSRTHGIPADTEAAVRLLLSARAHPVQVGRVNDRVFLVNASVGLYPQLLEDREAFKQQYGRSRFVALVSGLVTLMRQHRQLRLRIERNDDVRELRTPTLFVGNNVLQLQQIGLSEAECLDRGMLAALAVRPVGTLAMFWLMLRGAFGRLGDADNVHTFAFRRIVVKPRWPLGRRRVKVATDGEVLKMSPPLEFGVASDMLMLLKPDVVEAVS